jgi:hypothetical protein
MLHADGWTDSRTDMTKLIIALRNFANAPKNRPSYRARFEPTNIKTKKCEFEQECNLLHAQPNPDNTVIQPIQYIPYCGACHIAVILSANSQFTHLQLPL